MLARALVAVVLGAGALGCALLGPRWVSPALRNHPLVGKIWDVGAAHDVEWGELEARATSAHFVLLGEKHDNADHHLLQARLIRSIGRSGRRPAVVLEMIDSDRAAVLQAALTEHPGDVDAIGQALSWKTSGWPAWSLYRPVFEATLAHGLRPVAGNLSHEQRLELRSGRATPKIPPEVRAALARGVRRGHCGLAPASMIPKLIAVQAARDEQLAKALVQADSGDGAILIAGAGHVRRQIAVPRFLPLERTLVVAFIEVDPDESDPSSYAKESGFDLIAFTPRASLVDPCVRFREQLERGFGHPALERSLPR